MTGDDVSRFGPRLYGLFDDLDETPADDSEEGQPLGDDPPSHSTLDEVLEKLRQNGLDDPDA